MDPYKDRVTIEVIGISTDRGSVANRTYDWKGQGHGLVILDGSGELLEVIPGHSYGRDEIKAAFDKHLQ